MNKTLAELVYKQTLRAMRDYDKIKSRFERAKSELERLAHTPDWLRIIPGCFEIAKKEYDEARDALMRMGA